MCTNNIYKKVGTPPWPMRHLLCGDIRSVLLLLCILSIAGTLMLHMRQKVAALKEIASREFASARELEDSLKRMSALIEQEREQHTTARESEHAKHLEQLSQLQEEWSKHANDGGGTEMEEPEGVAAVIELDRECIGMAATVINILGLLPRTWIVQLFHGKQNKQSFMDNHLLMDLMTEGRLVMTEVSWSVANKGLPFHRKDRDKYNRLMTSERIWEEMIADKILIFQADTRLCSNSRRSIRDFLEYDYVGAPWQPRHALKLNAENTRLNGGDNMLRVGNGGLSLRSRSAMIANCKNIDKISSALTDNGTAPFLAHAEDIFHMFGLWWQNHFAGSDYKVAGVAAAAGFAVEWNSQEFLGMNEGDILGLHQLPGGVSDILTQGNSEKLMALCPDAISVLSKCTCGECKIRPAPPSPGAQ
jgi:hypothetical protein